MKAKPEIEERNGTKENGSSTGGGSDETSETAVAGEKVAAEGKTKEIAEA